MAFLKECPYCGKIYKSKRFYKLHERTHEVEPRMPEMVKTTSKEEEIKEPKIEKPKEAIVKPEPIGVQYREVVYLGTADKSTVRGKVTGIKYSFEKDEYGMPKPIKINERDYPGIIVLKGKGCVRRDPNILFMSKQDWDLEITGTRSANR